MGNASALSAVFAVLYAAKGLCAIPVGPGGTGVITFETAPEVSNWSTLAIAGGGSEITTPAAMDAAVQLLAAANISNTLATSATIPPSQFGQARWNSRWQLLQTRVTGIRYAVLMATLQNQTANPIAELQVRYAFGEGPIVFEEIPGWRAYFSLTGEPGSWTVVPEFCTSTSAVLTATLPLGAWPPNANLYILWADDRVTSADDAYYTMDDFSAEPSLPFLTITRAGPGTNQVVWRDFFTNFTLTTTTNLSAPIWLPVNDPDLPATGFHRVRILNNEPGRFFRLEQRRE